MFSMIRGRLTFANVAMVLVLVLAMSGGAFAAGKYLITSTKQISPKVLKALQGKAGKNGAVGAIGPQGPPGKDGANGSNGTNGKNGEPGQKGETGATGPKGAAGATGATGPKGATGATGATGPAFPVEENLPPGDTLRGMFAASGYSEVAFPEAGVGTAATGVSYAIKLSNIPGAHVIKVGATPPSECPGTEEAPAALPGNLCVFLTSAENAFAGGSVEVGPTELGFTVGTFALAKGPVSVEGTWAVTAE